MNPVVQMGIGGEVVHRNVLSGIEIFPAQLTQLHIDARFLQWTLMK